MDRRIVGTLLDLLEVFRPALTKPGFGNLLVIFVGWVLTQGDHAVTQALVVTGVAERVHWSRYHRFFSRGTWEPDEFGLLLFRQLLKLLPSDWPIRIAVDDTLGHHKGPCIFGLGSHIDAVRSTKKVKVFCFGHCWVVLAMLLPVPFTRRTFALPVLFRLYRNNSECEKKKAPYRKKTELAREMLDIVAGWVGGNRVEVAADSGYCNDTVMRGLAKNFVLIGSMRPDAVITAPPLTKRRKGSAGRPPKRGQLLPKPKDLAKDDRVPWRATTATLYGKTRKVAYKTYDGQWYRACGVRLLRIVVVSVETGNIGLRVFFCTDPSLSARQILEGYERRWAIEVAFRELKQMLGFGDSSARTKAAVLRVAPFVGLTYTTLVIWFAEGAYRSPLAAPPARPWYPHKRGLCFADVLRTAQRAFAALDVLDPGRRHDNLRETPPRRTEPRQRHRQRLRLAA